MNLILHFYRFTPFVRDHFLRSGLLAPKMTSPHFTYLVALRHWHGSGAAELAHFTINSQLDYTSKITKAKRVSAALVCLKLIHFLLDNKSSNVQLCFVKEVNRDVNFTVFCVIWNLRHQDRKYFYKGKKRSILVQKFVFDRATLF